MTDSSDQLMPRGRSTDGPPGDHTESLAPMEHGGESVLPDLTVGVTSVMATFASILKTRPRVDLEPTEFRADTSGASGASAESASSKERLIEHRPFEILGELGRGGMGVVLRVRDSDIGRDVAVKLLHEKYARNPEALRRFIEEAQIGGQLQHPGIVAVYEMGLARQRQPYFVMKMIKGRNFAQVLLEREELVESLPKMLAIFLQTCHAMAYAHERGVVHRDLKPANIMVGAFGAVQVADWGLAKIVGMPEIIVEDRESQAAPRMTRIMTAQRLEQESTYSTMGTVMGTLSYMPPEQARGEIDRIDQRSDVFALGSILCEILTRRPVYVGSREECFRLAHEGQQAEILALLAQCECDPVLLELALDCISPERDQRPLNAQVVAERIEAFQASVEHRAEQSRTAAVAERVKAEGERRARRLTLTLAATVLVVVIAAGVLVFVGQARRQSRIDAATEQTQSSIADAVRLIQAAKERGVDLALWEAASQAARRAEEMAGGEVSQNLARRARELNADVAAAWAAATDAQVEEKRRRALLNRVLEIREEAQRSPENSMRFLQSYRAAVADFGIDVMRVDLEVVADEVRKSSMAREVTSILDQCALLSIEAMGPQNPLLPALLSIARAVDDDPWRTRLRNAVGTESTEELLELASTFDRSVEPATLVLLGGLLARAGMTEEAMAVFEKGALYHPSDFLLHMEAATIMLNSRDDEAYSSAQSESARARGLAHLQAAIALRPELPSPWKMLAQASTGATEQTALETLVELEPRSGWVAMNLGTFFLKKGDPAAALQQFGRAIELESGDPANLDRMGVALQRMERHLEALDFHRKAVEIAKDNVDFQHNLANNLRQLGRREEALAVLEELIEQEPTRALSHSALATLLLEMRQRDAAIAAMARALELGKDLDEVRRSHADFLRKLGDAAAAESSFRDLLATNPRDLGALIGLSNALAKANRNREEIEEAIATARLATEVAPKSDASWHTLGNAYYQSGDLDAAYKSYEESARLNPRSALAVIELGNIHLNREEFVRAIEVHRQAIAIDPSHPRSWINLSAALIKNEQWAEAIVELKQAIERFDDEPQLFLNLGFALMNQGLEEEAIPYLERGQSLDVEQIASAGTWTRLIAAARLGARADETYEEITSGKRAPVDAAEALALGAHFHQKRKYDRSLALHELALEQFADDLPVPQRSVHYNAACAAALLGGSIYRERALAHLRESLADFTAAAAAGGDLGELTRSLEHWLVDSDLVSVREAAELAAYSKAESETWKELWRSVREQLALLQRKK